MVVSIHGEEAASRPICVQEERFQEIQYLRSDAFSRKLLADRKSPDLHGRMRFHPIFQMRSELPLLSLGLKPQGIVEKTDQPKNHMAFLIQNLVVLDPQPSFIDQTITFEEVIEIVIGAKVQRKLGNIFRRQRTDQQVVPLEDVAK